MKCKYCKEEMLKCGFGTVGGLCGNARWECRNEDCSCNNGGQL